MADNWVWFALGGVGGWALSQFGSLAADAGRRLLLKRSIVSELRQVYEECDRIWKSCARSLQIQSLGGIEPAVPLPMSDKVFASHYSDASLVFTRTQRIAMEMIHSYVAKTNESIGRLERIIHDAHDSKKDPQKLDTAIERYGEALEGLMMAVASTKWNASHYLRHPDFPILEDEGQDIDSYRSYLDSAKQEIKRISASAVGIPREAFESYSVPDPPN